MNNQRRKPVHPLIAVIPLIVLVFLLYATVNTFGNDALSGPIQIVLIATTAITSMLAIVLGYARWSTIEKTICNNILSVSSAILILFLIGALSGSWMVSGIVPTLIYYGMKIIHPDFFLVTSCFICAVISIMTGSSWTTIATIGVALMGIGTAQGFSEGWIAGAIISGAYFGDKVSPLSDTTLLASSITDTDLFPHIQYLMYTTVPSFIITLITFTVMGLVNANDSATQIALFTDALQNSFDISLWLLIVPAITAVLIFKKVPAMITLFTSALMAGICILIFQPGLLIEIANETTVTANHLFKGLFMTYYGSTNIDTGNEILDALVATRGMGGMLNTVWLIICAMCFGGAMQGSGMLASLTSVLIRIIKSGTSLVASTVASGVLFNIIVADQYISIMLTGNMFKELYKKEGYDSRVLSRATEDSSTVTSVLVPWNSCAMAQSSILSVSTITYLPYCFFNLISPFMSIFVMAIGYNIKRLKTVID